MNIEVLESALLVGLGGFFGWLLGKLPERYIYMLMAVVILLALVVLGR